MDFLDLAKRRDPVRSDKEAPVEEEKVARILEAAGGKGPPSAANLQPTRLVVVDDKALEMGKLSRAANVYSAPLADHRVRGSRESLEAP